MMPSARRFFFYLRFFPYFDNVNKVGRSAPPATNNVYPGVRTAMTVHSHRLPVLRPVQWLKRAATGIAFAITVTCPAWASGSGMPWETPMENIENSLTGPVAKIIGIFAITMFGLTFAFSEHGSTLKKAMGILMGLSIAFSAASFGATFFGFSGGAAF
jgi:type IV secretion system protein VirB2